MEWWNSKSDIPYSDVCFEKIINFFVFNCPASIRSKRKDTALEKKKVEIVNPVSSRENITFKSRGITGNILTTMLVTMRRPLIQNNTYAMIETSENVPDKRFEIEMNASLSDTMFDLIVFQKRDDMPETEAIFYYIRNSFAHGSFEIVNSNATKIYLLESRKDKVKAQMRLKESTLLSFIDIANKTPKEIQEMQNSRKKRSKHIND